MFENFLQSSIGGFSNEALSFAEDLLGTCGQKKAREARKGQRTQAQQAADESRSQALRGKDTLPSSSRSEAARKGAETRAKCRGTQPQQPTTSVG